MEGILPFFVFCKIFRNLYKLFLQNKSVGVLLAEVLFASYGVLARSCWIPRHSCLSLLMLPALLFPMILLRVVFLLLLMVFPLLWLDSFVMLRFVFSQPLLFVKLFNLKMSIYDTELCS
jgi:hypothetical protein